MEDETGAEVMTTTEVSPGRRTDHMREAGRDGIGDDPETEALIEVDLRRGDHLLVQRRRKLE